jgi:hypothetical protein
MKSCSDHVMGVPLLGCPKSECRLTCVRMQWVTCTICALCPLLAVSCGDTGLGLFTLTVSSPRMDCSAHKARSFTSQPSIRCNEDMCVKIKMRSGKLEPRDGAQNLTCPAVLTVLTVCWTLRTVWYTLGQRPKRRVKSDSRNGERTKPCRNFVTYPWITM